MGSDRQNENVPKGSPGGHSFIRKCMRYVTQEQWHQRPQFSKQLSKRCRVRGVGDIAGLNGEIKGALVSLFFGQEMSENVAWRGALER